MGGNASSVKVEPTLHHRTVSMTMEGNADCTAVERCQAGRLGDSSVDKYNVCQRAQNRATKGFNCRVRRNTLPICV